MLAAELLGAAAVLLGGLVITRRAPRLPVARKERWKADPEDQGGGWSIQVSPVPSQYLGRRAVWACLDTAHVRVPAAQLPSKCLISKHLDLLAYGTRRQVLLPCYTETAALAAAAGESVLAARLPPGCSVTLRVLDDGRDPAKAAWAAAAGARCPGKSVRYLCERARPECEVRPRPAQAAVTLRSCCP